MNYSYSSQFLRCTFWSSAFMIWTAASMGNSYHPVLVHWTADCQVQGGKTKWAHSEHPFLAFIFPVHIIVSRSFQLGLSENITKSPTTLHCIFFSTEPDPLSLDQSSVSNSSQPPYGPWGPLTFVTSEFLLWPLLMHIGTWCWRWQLLMVLNITQTVARKTAPNTTDIEVQFAQILRSNPAAINALES